MSVDATNIDLTFLAKQNEKILSELATMRREMSDVRTLCIGTTEYSRRLDRRLTEVKDDLELILKVEISGAFMRLETKLDHRLSAIEDRLAALEQKP